jgi:ribosomal protein L19E
MNLKNKKRLIARTLKVGIRRISINKDMTSEIKEAITRQDMRDLKKEKIIKIKEVKGRKKKVKRKTKRRLGSIKKKVKNSKQKYVKLVRKQRAYIKVQSRKEIITKEQYRDLRKKVRAKNFRDLSHLKEFVKEITK